ncbi:MAG: choice-of-anchor Q domain-containing protein [Chloroflexota bacterium]
MAQARKSPGLAAYLLRQLSHWYTDIAQSIPYLLLFLSRLHSRRRWHKLKQIVLSLLIGGGLTTFLTGSAWATEITVTHTNDVIDNSDGCGLREAIINANTDSQLGSTDCPAGNGSDVITLITGTTTLTKTGAYEDATLTGDLDIVTGTITIQGQGQNLTVINGNRSDRIFHVHPNATLELSLVTVQNGAVENKPYAPVLSRGGGIFNDGGVITLTNSTVDNNTVLPDPLFPQYHIGGSGGGIANALLSTITIVSSTISNNNADSIGGGIFNLSSITISDSVIVNNGSHYGGGGIFNRYGTMTLSNSMISNNYVYYGGGGISSCTSSTMTVSNSTITNNNAAYGSGGGIDNCSSSTLTLSNSLVSNNQASSFGGGIYNHLNSTLTMFQTTVSSNTSDGGGIFNSHSSTAKLYESTISNNNGWNGGIVNDSSSTMEISQSTISSNTGIMSGGVTNSPNSLLKISNSTISDNIGRQGAGVGNSGVASITNSTISGNLADTNGGGIANSGSAMLQLMSVTLTNNRADNQATNDGDGGGLYTAPTASAVLSNTIIAGNQDNSPNGGAIQPDGSGSITGAAHNLVSDLTGITGNLGTGSDIVVTSLGLDPLADNGGGTQTHGLQTGSPAIDAGDHTLCTANPINNLDQRGEPRIVTICDIGAFERQDQIIIVLPIIHKN